MDVSSKSDANEDEDVDVDDELKSESGEEHAVSSLDHANGFSGALSASESSFSLSSTGR
jgi:hypothetical protein